MTKHLKHKAEEIPYCWGCVSPTCPAGHPTVGHECPNFKAGKGIEAMLRNNAAKDKKAISTDPKSADTVSKEST
jgi:hypothetical protein